MNSFNKNYIYQDEHAKWYFDTLSNNKKQLFTGWHDPHLTEKGMAAAINLQSELSSIKFNHVYSSPLLRAATTAICIVGDDTSIEYDDRLKERSYGDWSGLNKTEVKQQIGEASFFSARKRKIKNKAVHPIPINPFLMLVSAPHRSKNNAPITRPST